MCFRSLTNVFVKSSKQMNTKEFLVSSSLLTKIFCALLLGDIGIGSNAVEYCLLLNFNSNSKSPKMFKVVFLSLSALALIAPANAEHQEGYLCKYGSESEELVIGTALGVKGDLYFEDLMWTKNGRKLIFSYPDQVRRNMWRNPDAGIVKRDQQGREWLVITKTSRGSGTMWLGTGKMSANQYRGPIINCKIGLTTLLRKKAEKFMNNAH